MLHKRLNTCSWNKCPRWNTRTTATSGCMLVKWLAHTKAAGFWMLLHVYCHKASWANQLQSHALVARLFMLHVNTVFMYSSLGIQLQIYNCCIKTWKENVAGHRWRIKCSVTSSVKQMPFACVFLFLFVPPTFAHMPVTLTEPPQTFWLKLLVKKTKYIKSANI